MGPRPCVMCQEPRHIPLGLLESGGPWCREVPGSPPTVLRGLGKPSSRSPPRLPTPAAGSLGRGRRLLVPSVV